MIMHASIRVYLVAVYQIDAVRFVVAGNREEHESNCDFAWEKCPFDGDQCGSFRRKDLQSHMNACTNVPCRYKDKGNYNGHLV